jgi:hypothetical protein
MSVRANSLALVLSLSLAAACGGGDSAADADLTPDAPPPTGSISLSWRIQQGGDAASCEDVGAQFVVLTLLRQGEAGGETEAPNCSAGELTTRGLKLGTYNVTIDLVDQSTNSLLDEPESQTGIEVTANQSAQLGEIVFDL